MILPRDGAEYARWTPTPATSEALEVSFDSGTTWHDLTLGTVTGDVWAPDAGGSVHAILLAGPSIGTVPAGATQLSLGAHGTRIRLADDPETVVRDAGTIIVK